MSKQNKRLDCCLDLMRRMPPQNVEKNLSDLIQLAPEDLMEDLLATVDQPLKVSVCPETQRQYLLCDYNRDGDSYRSPWSNKYDPPLSDGAVPSSRLRTLEIEINTGFNQYRELYYEGGISSVYLWDIDGGFAGVVLIKKNTFTKDIVIFATEIIRCGEGSKKIQGCWDSLHVFEVEEKKSGTSIKCNIQLTSNIMLWLQNNSDNGSLNLGGNLTRQSQMSGTVTNENTHLEFIGRMIEDMESRMRQTISEVYFGKIKDIRSSLRSNGNLSDIAKWKDVASDLNARLSVKKPQ